MSKGSSEGEILFDYFSQSLSVLHRQRAAYGVWCCFIRSLETPHSHIIIIIIQNLLTIPAESSLILTSRSLSHDEIKGHWLSSITVT